MCLIWSRRVFDDWCTAKPLIGTENAVDSARIQSTHSKLGIKRKNDGRKNKRKIQQRIRDKGCEKKKRCIRNTLDERKKRKKRKHSFYVRHDCVLSRIYSLITRRGKRDISKILFYKEQRFVCCSIAMACKFNLDLK